MKINVVEPTPQVMKQIKNKQMNFFPARDYSNRFDFTQVLQRLRKKGNSRKPNRNFSLEKPLQLLVNPLNVVFDLGPPSTLSLDTRNSVSKLVGNNSSFMKSVFNRVDQQLAKKQPECKQTEIDLPSVLTS